LKTYTRAALILGVVSSIAILGTASADSDGSKWFKDAIADLLTRLQQVESATAWNTASITALTGEVNALKGGGAQTYDYRNYEVAANVTRTYHSQGAGICGTTEVQGITRTPQADGSTQVSQARTRLTAANTICEYNVFDFRATSDGLYLAGRTGFNPANTSEVVNTNVLDSLLPQRTTAMRIGATFGSAAGMTSFAYPAGATTLSTASQVNTLLAVEEVTVPAGTFSSCLKISEIRNSFAIGNFSEVSWYCQGVGLAKRVFASPTGSPGFKLELQSIK